MKYRAILIDADDTLFDFQAAEKHAIADVLTGLGITEVGADAAYSRINHKCWLDFEKGMLTQKELKIRRFRELITRYGVDADPKSAAIAYEEALSRQPILIDGALETVRQIAEALPVAIVTNGISTVQHGRMSRSPLRECVKALVISEEVGCAKPDKRMIEAALFALGGIGANQALMAGDSLTSDMQCAINAGTDACWYNPARHAVPETMNIRYVIDDIRDLAGVALS